MSQIDDDRRKQIVAGKSEWQLEECPVCGKPVGRDYRLPDHLEDEYPEL